MRRIMLTLEYDGADFCGWQVQAEGRTVQGALEQAIAKATGETVRVTGAGRTDSGVHAEGQVAHFDTDCRLSAFELLKAINYYLPADASALDCREAPEDFNARFSAESKLYRYRLLRSAMRRPLRDRRALRVRRPLDVDVMQHCASLLVGEHDFTSFASQHTEVASKVRRLTRSECAEHGDELHYLVEGDGFLYNMVRIIVGTLIMVGLGKTTEEQFAAALDARDRKAAGATAPARGLTLVRVAYRLDPRPEALHSR